MAITIKNKEQLDNCKRELERMEFQISGAQEQIDEFRAAISEYENGPARIAGELSTPAMIVLEYMCLLSSELCSAENELTKFGIYGMRNTAGLAVLAEVKKSKTLGCKYEVLRVYPGGTTENRGFYIGRAAASFALACMWKANPDGEYKIRVL